MRSLLLLSVPVAILLLAPAGVGLHCNGEITTIETPVTTFYIDERAFDDSPSWRVVYMETNGVAGLQSGYEPICYEHDNTCWTINLLVVDYCHHWNHDTKIF